MLTVVVICRVFFVGELFTPVVVATKLDICAPTPTTFPAI
jgi:hypothetical protein